MSPVVSAFRRNLNLPALIVFATPPLAKATEAKPAAREQDPVHWTAVGPARVRPGATFDVTLTATIDDEWHVYSVTQGPGGPIPTTIAVPGAQPFARAGAVRGPAPTRAFDQNFDIETETYDGTIAL